MISLLKASTVPEAKACSVIAKRRGGIYSPQPVPPARPVDHDRHRLTQGDRPPKTKHAFVEFFPPRGVLAQNFPGPEIATTIDVNFLRPQETALRAVKPAKNF